LEESKVKTFSIFTTLPLWQAKSFQRLPGQFVWIQAISPSIQKKQLFFLFSRFTNNMKKATWKISTSLILSKEVARKITRSGKT